MRPWGAAIATLNAIQVHVRDAVDHGQPLAAGLHIAVGLSARLPGAAHGRVGHNRGDCLVFPLQLYGLLSPGSVRSDGQQQGQVQVKGVVL